MKSNHTLALIVVVAVAVSILHSANLAHMRASSAADSIQELSDPRGFLSGPITAHAAGRGNPWVTLRDGSSAPAQYEGSPKAVQQLKENAMRPLSVGAADFDEDGIPDLVAGYAGAQTGVISIQRGDADTIYPNTRDAIAHSAQLRAGAPNPPAPDDVQSPFFVNSRTFDVSTAPEFLGAGDFDGDGHSDVLTAQNDSGSLVLLSGDGRGGFPRSRQIALPGKVTSMSTGDVNRIDGLADVLVAVKGSGSPRLLVYEGAGGALNAAPEIIALPAEAKSVAWGQLDDSFPVDIVVGAGRELIVIRGRDRKRSTADGQKLNAEPPVVTRIDVSFSVTSVSVGDFTGDDRREIAALSDDGTCHVFSRGGSGWQKVNAVALAANKTASTRILMPARLSSSPKDDLVVLDQASRKLHIVINDSAVMTDEAAKAIASSNLRVAGAIDFEGEPVAVLGMRLNADALNDLVVLKSNTSAPTVIMTAPAATFTVTNTNDSLAGSLRQAIINANGSPGPDLINFNITPAGNQTISPLSQLPSITGPVTIDGTTQNPGSATPPIELAGNNAGIEVRALSITGNCTVRGLVINRFNSLGIELSGSGSIVEGNFIGTNATGTSAQGNADTGVVINGGTGHLIGGTVAAARNVVSGNIGHGVLIFLGVASDHLIRGNFIGTNAAGTLGLGNQSDGVQMLSGSNDVMNCTVGGTTPGAGNVISANTGVGVQFITVGTVNLIQGNLIGTDASGSNDLGNGSAGVAITEANDCTIGGTVAGAGNVISGNGAEGVRLNSPTATGNRVQGNKIGTRADGTTPLPNSLQGVRVLNSSSNNTIGGTAGQGNIIAFNLANGVAVETGTGNLIQSNSIFSNGSLGIDLGALGITPNDAGDGDSGANNLQNFPVLTSSNGAAGGGVNIQGSLNSTANTTFTLDFFSNPSCDISGNGEGQTFLGSASVSTNGAGNVTFNVTIIASATVGDSITATATNPQGNTSEFSACVIYGAADLAINKTASSATVVAGSNVTYTITLTNNGPDPASSVTVTDNLPGSLSFISCSSTGSGVCGGSGNNRIVSFASLASGASATITIVARLDCSVSNGLIVGNTAAVTSPVRDPIGGNNSSSVNFTASNPPRTITPTSASYQADGGSGSVSVTAPAGCGWQAVSNASWIIIDSGSSGTGNGTVGYTVAANGTGSARMGTVTIAQLTFTVNQSNVPCSYSILPVSESIPSSGGGGNVAVTTQGGCIWKAISNDAWIMVVFGTENGIGSGSTSYTVQANTSTTPRTGTITIAGQTFTVMQAGVPCEFSIEPRGKLFGEIGAEDTFQITTSAGCDWTAATTQDWIFISSEESGTGPGTISYGVRDNLTGSPREGRITVDGLSFAIVQDGGTLGDCVYVVTPSAASFSAAGGKGNFQIITEERCAWDAIPQVNWITVTSQVVGIGTNTITYNVKPNPTSAGRAGIILIGGQQFKVKQKGG